jgi:hypothetical protein
MILNSPYISGSLTVTGNITACGGVTISGSIASASYAANTTFLNGLGSEQFVPTGSFNTFSSSILTYTGSANSRLGSLETTSGSNITRLGALEVASGSAITRLNSIETVTGSNITRLSSLEAKTGSYATTGSNTFDGGQYLSSSFNPTGFSTTASLYTDGGLRVTRDAYISGTLYLNNVTVFGTQSVAYISSSQLNIGTNLITVNTDTPSVRFGGLAVYDSGSTGLTGSLLWDSQNNHWVYSNPSGSSYSGGMFISGPRTSTLGSETGTTSCMLLAGQGGDHLTSSMIYHSSTTTCIPNTLIGGTVNVGTITSVCGVISGTPANSSSLLLENFNGDQTATTLKLKSGRSDVFYHMQAFSGNTTEVFRIEASGRVVSASTISGTTLYGSTAVCSPVGKFTSCIDAGSGTFSGNITNVSALYVRASGNSDLPFINFSNADGVYNWGRVGGCLQGDGDGALYFQTKLGGGLTTKLTINSTGAATFSSSGLFSGNLQTNGALVIGNQSCAGTYFLNITPSTTCSVALQGSLAGVGIAAILIQPSGGNVGIGASINPQNLLEVSSTGGSPRIRVGTLQNNDNTARFEAITSNGTTVANSAWLRVNDASGFTLGQSSYTKAGGDSGNFANLSSEVESPAVIVQGNGDVLIGSGTTAEGPLDVYRSNSGGLGGHILLRNNGSAVANETAVLFVDGGVGTTRAAISSTTENSPYFGDLKFKTGLGTYACLNTRMTIAGSTGYVGISVTSACKNLEVGGTIRTTVSPSVFYRDMSYIGDNYQFGPGETTDNVDFKICGGSTWATGGNFRWFTQTGNGTPSERLRIIPGGQTQFIHSTSDLDILYARNGSASPYGMNITFTAAAPNNGSNNFLYLADSTTLRFAARSNGGLSNFSGNNVNLASDIRLKKDISPLSSEWNKLKQIEVVNFKYKDSTDETALYGAIAQQVQEIYPNLVIVTREATETEPEYYGLREQPFQWLTTKVLQEAMAKIETQQCTINTLKTCLGIA